MASGTDVSYWTEEFAFQYSDWKDEDTLEEGLEHTVERALESFESELRAALQDRIDQMIEDREQTCDDCGVLLTDENKPDDRGWYGPDSGYCAKCAAANE